MCVALSYEERDSSALTRVEPTGFMRYMAHARYLSLCHLETNNIYIYIDIHLYSFLQCAQYPSYVHLTIINELKPCRY